MTTVWLSVACCHLELQQNWKPHQPHVQKIMAFLVAVALGMMVAPGRTMAKPKMQKIATKAMEDTRRTMALASSRAAIANAIPNATVNGTQRSPKAQLSATSQSRWKPLFRLVPMPGNRKTSVRTAANQNFQMMKRKRKGRSARRSVARTWMTLPRWMTVLMWSMMITTARSREVCCHPELQQSWKPHQPHVQKIMAFLVAAALGMMVAPGRIMAKPRMQKIATKAMEDTRRTTVLASSRAAIANATVNGTRRNQRARLSAMSQSRWKLLLRWCE